MTVPSDAAPLPGRYPPIEPYETGMLDVGDGHRVYWECCGNPAGRPALIIHGGPGSGTAPSRRRYFDPRRYRIISFDQRNCGQSTPSAADPNVDLTTNTTWHLIADMERLRDHLAVEKWLLMGTSWGVSLALAYAEMYPERVSALVLAAVTSGSRRETDWITRSMGRVFPREWDRFRDGVPVDDRDGDLSAAYHRLLESDDPAVRAKAAHDWCLWEDTHVSLAPGAEPYLSVADPTFQYVIARIVTHYWSQGCFFDDEQVIRDVGRLAGIPGVLIHGRYDVSGPLDTAWALHKAWPESTLVVLDDAGHGGGSMSEEIVAATNRFAGP